MNNKTKEIVKEDKERSIKIKFGNDQFSIKFTQRNTINGLKKHIKEKYKITDEQINNYYFYLILLDNTEIKIEKDKIFYQYIFEHNLIHFNFKKDENKKQTLSNCDIKFNNLEQKYNELNKKYNDLLKRESENENKIKEQELKINKIFLLLEEKQIEKKEDQFPILDEQILSKEDINNDNNENSLLKNNKVDTKNENIQKNEPFNKNKYSPLNEKIVDKDIITNPGINFELLFNKNAMPMVLKSQINKTITCNLQIKNIGTIDLPKNCKFIIRNETSNLTIINPDVNIIKIGEISNFQLNLKFIDINNINLENNDIEVAIHSESFGLLSNWIQLTIYVKDDSQNILIMNK